MASHGPSPPSTRSCSCVRRCSGCLPMEATQPVPSSPQLRARARRLRSCPPGSGGRARAPACPLAAPAGWAGTPCGGRRQATCAERGSGGGQKSSTIEDTQHAAASVLQPTWRPTWRRRRCRCSSAARHGTKAQRLRHPHPLFLFASVQRVCSRQSDKQPRSLAVHSSPCRRYNTESIAPATSRFRWLQTRPPPKCLGRCSTGSWPSYCRCMVDGMHAERCRRSVRRCHWAHLPAAAAAAAHPARRLCPRLAVRAAGLLHVPAHPAVGPGGRFLEPARRSAQHQPRGGGWWVGFGSYMYTVPVLRHQLH